jgi:hypothetical protein
MTHRGFRVGSLQFALFVFMALMQSGRAQKSGGTAQPALPLWLGAPSFCLCAPRQAQSPAVLPLTKITPKLGLTKEDWPQFLATARDKALLYAAGLPNFTCIQTTRCYAGQTRQLSFPTGVSVASGTGRQIGPGLQQGEGLQWILQDEIVQEVIYSNQQEHYKLLKRAHPSPATSEVQQGGLISTGEFGSTLKSLFDPASKADFWFEKIEKIRRWKSARAKFQVSQENSDREIVYGAESDTEARSLRVAYGGLVWFEIASGQVIRLQFETLNLPTDFPIAHSAWAIDYDVVGIGPEEYRLPVRAEVQSVTSSCKDLLPTEKNRHTRNVIEFKQYHKFETEVKVLPD